MAIITCEKCGKKYSDQAPDGCPECGIQDTQKINQQNGHRTINKQLTIYLVVAFFVGFFAGREHIKYEIRKNIAAATKSIASTFRGEKHTENHAEPEITPSETAALMTTTIASDSDQERTDYISLIEILNFRISKGDNYGKVVPAVFGTIKNNGNRSLRKVEITVYFLDSDDNVIGEEDFYPVLVSDFSIGDDNKPLKPNYVKDFGYSVDDAPSTWAKKARVAVTNVDFMEGQ